MRKVYLDHAATTPLHPEVYSLMCRFMKDTFGNPSSIHSYGQEAYTHPERVVTRC
ncbi:MAG: hypothetical protein PWQ99_172 [Clostridia bacterium]|jgi:cysteine desulfurase|nr:hypothetical protein [Clostridia bacterium]MDN5374972.1 hypothetical protein [Thermacetogenium sp.]